MGLRTVEVMDFAGYMVACSNHGPLLVLGTFTGHPVA